MNSLFIIKCSKCSYEDNIENFITYEKYSKNPFETELLLKCPKCENKYSLVIFCQVCKIQKIY